MKKGTASHARAPTPAGLLAVAVTVTLLAAGCARTPIEPVPYREGQTAAWFRGDTGTGLGQLYKSTFQEAVEARDSRQYAEAVRTNRELAKEGVPEAAYELGKAYRYGQGVAQDSKLAARWLIAAVSRSHSRWPHASYHLGTMFLDGEGVPRKPDLARKLLTQALTHEYPAAAFPLARIYAEGLGVKKDMPRARRLAHVGAEAGDIDSYLWLLRGYQPGGILGRNKLQANLLAERVLALLRNRVQEGNDPAAMRYLATIHHEGLGRPKDVATAIGWLHRAAAAGRPDFIVDFGEDVLNGTDGYRANPAQGFHILQSAAERYRHPEAMELLAKAHRDGIGTEPDMAKAEAWYKRAVKAGSIDAHFGYGRMLVERTDDPRAVRRGAQLLEKAAQAGMPFAWAKLGELHVDRGFEGADPAEGIKYLKRAHEAGIATATSDLGQAYLRGTGVNPDADKAEALLKEAAEQGQNSALMALVHGYLEGKVLPRRPDAAAAWLKKAVENEVEGARLLLGRTLLSGDIPGDPKKGKEIVISFAREGDVFAMMELGRALRDGRTIPANHDAARYWFEKAMAAGGADAESTLASMLFADAYQKPMDFAKLEEAAQLGHSGAMSVLGQAYLQGEGVEPSPVIGGIWLHRAAEAGNPHAAATLGSAYLYGEYGLDKDPAAARKMLEMAVARDIGAAERELGYALMHPGETGLGSNPRRGLALLREAASKGDAYAMELLGNAYLGGNKGVEAQPENAEIWLKRAAEKGDISSMTTLGSAYIEGGILSRQVQTGMRYLGQAAEKGDATAQARLGRIYLEGVPGVQRDAEKAAEYLESAARAGNAGAMASLGRAYVNGELGERRIDEGARLLVRAARAGHETARYALAVAVLKSHGVENMDREYAEAWLRSMTASETEVAVQTLAEMLREGDFNIPQFDPEGN